MAATTSTSVVQSRALLRVSILLLSFVSVVSVRLPPHATIDIASTDRIQVHPLPAAQNPAGVVPQQIHLALTGDATQMAVTWVTKTATPAPAVSFEVASATDQQRQQVQSAATVVAAKTHTYTGGGWEGFIHTAVMTGLAPGRKQYTYKVGDTSTGTWTDSIVFKTAVPGSTNTDDTISHTSSTSNENKHEQEQEKEKDGGATVTFATWGDMGTNRGAPGNDHFVTSLADGNIPELDDLDFVLLQGDIAYDKGKQDVWDTFYQEVQPFASRLPLMTCPGNEDHALNFTGYLNRVFMPGQAPDAPHAPWWYSFNYGLVHVVSMATEQSHDGGVGYWNGTAQWKWLEADLKGVDRKAQPWVVVIGHRPLYCSSNDYYDCEMWGPKARKALEPLFCHYGVDLYLSGHVHSYERTFPVCGAQSKSHSYSNPTAPVHVMNGAGGAGLTSKWSTQPAWSAKRIIHYGVGYVQANATALDFRFLLTGQNGTVAVGDPVVIGDHFTIVKNHQAGHSNRIMEL
eukprot:CAMPEP_0197858816 /NCGR_PEP_ID=MMETSP1438-20131217/32891_1 /TAXON_ID=1461541 /ORGANISM="Pterosperma sp., Strain CCMP1384" /LENGTH=513 /DNA_ID=CAMNT_0043475087 /DNA_START=119 /DNA_END=1657 /DNA_ORIENTATION=+